MYGGLTISTSHFCGNAVAGEWGDRGATHDLVPNRRSILGTAVVFLVPASSSGAGWFSTARTFALRKWTSFLARGERRLVLMLYSRFCCASVSARVLISTPRMVRFEMCGARREWRSREMQPVPVHASRIWRDRPGEACGPGRGNGRCVSK